MPGSRHTPSPKKELAMSEEHTQAIASMNSTAIMWSTGRESKSKQGALTEDASSSGLHTYNKGGELLLRSRYSANVSASLSAVTDVAETAVKREVADNRAISMHHKQPPNHSYAHSNAARTAGSLSASPPQLAQQRHRPYTHHVHSSSSVAAVNASPSPPLYASMSVLHQNSRTSLSPSPPLLTQQTPYPPAASNLPYNSVSRVPSRHNQLLQSPTPYYTSASGPAPPSHQHNYYHPHSQQQQQQQHPASMLPTITPQHHGTYHSHSISMPINHVYAGAVASHTHTDSTSSVSTHLHPGNMSHSASTSPIVPPGVRALQGTYSRQLTAEEKEMKRKVSHSAIEKRRRERTNAVLRELQEIVPGLSKPGKIQKLEILEAAADYIRQLTSGQKAHMHKSSKHGRRHNFQPHPYRHYEYQPHPRDEHNERTHFDMPQSHSVDLGRVVSEELSTSQPTAMATPLSECTNAPTEDARSSPPTDDPSSMKVNFLLC